MDKNKPNRQNNNIDSKNVIKLEINKISNHHSSKETDNLSQSIESNQKMLGNNCNIEPLNVPQHNNDELIIKPVAEQHHNNHHHSEQSPTNSNSTDNLSYYSDNNYIEELLLLQSTLSDEDDEYVQSVNSDDCVYAYRGGDDADQLRHNLPSNNSNMEDETDFLEMDFDPEMDFDQIDDNEILPNEEHLRNHHNDLLLNEIAIIQDEQQQLQPADNAIGNMTTGLSNILFEDNMNKHILQIDSNDLKCNGNSKHNEILNNNEISNDQSSDENKTMRITGAKPKKFVENKNLHNSSMSNNLNSTNKLRKIHHQKQKSFELKDNDNNKRYDIKTNDLMRTQNIQIEHDDDNDCIEDVACLDCLEKEFLQTTVGKIIENNGVECFKCKFRKNKTVNCIDDESIDVNEMEKLMSQKTQQHNILDDSYLHSESILNFNFNNKFNNQHLLLSTKSNGDNQRTYSCDNNDLLLSTINNKETSKISSINVDSDIIMQAFDKLNIKYDTDLINDYFKINTRSTFNDVADLILYSSKKNCNYKNIIRLLKTATKDQIKIEFNYDNTAPSYEVVQVNVNDIIQCWMQNNDLTKLKKLNLRFFEMNILGKIINLIRQSVSKQSATGYLLIPQYYKSGFITLTKKN